MANTDKTPFQYTLSLTEIENEYLLDITGWLNARLEDSGDKLVCSTDQALKWILQSILHNEDTVAEFYNSHISDDTENVLRAICGRLPRQHHPTVIDFKTHQEIDDVDD